MTQPRSRTNISMAVHEDLESAIAEITVIGEFDRLQVENFEKTLENLPPALVAVTVDLTAATTIDSAALGCLVRLRHTLLRAHCRLDVVVQRPFQVVVMKVGGLYDFLHVRLADNT